MKSSKTKSPSCGAPKSSPQKKTIPVAPAVPESLISMANGFGVEMTAQVVAGMSYVVITKHPYLAPGLYVDLAQRVARDAEEMAKGLVYVAGPFIVMSHGRDANNEGWGVYLWWYDPEGVEHQSLVLFSKISGPDSSREIARLRGAGLRIAPGRRSTDAFISYLLGIEQAQIVRSVRRVGWYQDVFVRPDRVFGDPGENSLIDYIGPDVAGYEAVGTLEEWREHVGMLCIGNSRLVFVVSMAFAGFLLDLCDVEGGGIHLLGLTSEGKSVALAVAASVHGKPEKFGHEWSTTANAIEVTCAGRNHQVLIIDELGRLPQIKLAAYIVYTIANGSGKARMTVDGELRELITWALLVLSGGEVDLEVLERESGNTPRGGTQVRMASVPVNAGRGMGIVEELHGADSSKTFVEALHENAQTYFGQASITFLERLTAPETLAAIRAGLSAQLDEAVGEMQVPIDASAEVMRVAKRFALIALAGELATAFGITGWPDGEAVKAAVRCFHDWHEARQANIPFDELEVLRRIKHRVEAGLLGGMVDMSEPDDWHNPVNLIGFKKPSDQGDGVAEYWILSQQFTTELLKGVANPAQVKKMLVDRGWLIKPEKDHYSSSVSIPSLGKKRVYRLDAAVMSEDAL